jgi:GT2 family glycosyltransferase
VSTPLVCAIVLNYNGREHLEYCLPSVLSTDYQPFKVIVVDNASTDDSVRYVRQRFPHVILVESSTNRGWSGGNNLGIIRACQLGAEYTLLANNDIRVDRRWASVAVTIAHKDPRVGIVGFRIYDAHGSKDDAGFEQAVREWSGTEITTSQPVGGMAMFVRSSLYENIGLIDEGFFAYAEDNDFEIRVRRACYRVVTTNVPIWHHGQGYWERAPLQAASLQIRNNLRLALKHDSPARVIYQLARHFAKGCLPFVRTDRDDPIARRLRPSNIFVNFFILLYAVAWNVWHLPETLYRRRRDKQRVQSTRSHLGQI